MYIWVVFWKVFLMVSKGNHPNLGLKSSKLGSLILTSLLWDLDPTKFIALTAKSAIAAIPEASQMA